MTELLTHTETSEDAPVPLRDELRALCRDGAIL